MRSCLTNVRYISDVGATNFKPLFIAMGAVTVVSLDLVFVFERYLRHAGTLAVNTSGFQKILSILSTIFAIIGALGLILLTIFDTLHHNHVHDAMLVVFLAGYIISAIFICWEYQRLGIHYRQHRILRISFWIKLAFIFIEVGLAIGFGVCGDRDEYNAAAILEWIVAFIFTFYVLSFAIDFLPALRTKHHHSRETELDMAEAEAGYGATNGNGNAAAAASGDRYYGDGVNGTTNGYTNGNTGGWAANGVATQNGYKPPEPQNVAPSRNF